MPSLVLPTLVGELSLCMVTSHALSSPAYCCGELSLCMVTSHVLSSPAFQLGENTSQEPYMSNSELL